MGELWKKYITFCMEKDELEKSIKEYFKLQFKDWIEISENYELAKYKRILSK